MFFVNGLATGAKGLFVSTFTIRLYMNLDQSDIQYAKCQIKNLNNISEIKKGLKITHVSFYDVPINEVLRNMHHESQIKVMYKR